MHPVPAVVPEEVHPPSPTATTRRRTGASAARAGRRAPGAQRQALPQGELPSQGLARLNLIWVQTASTSRA